MVLSQKSFNLLCIMKHLLSIVMLIAIKKKHKIKLNKGLGPLSQDLTTLQSYHKNTTVPEFDFNKLFPFMVSQ